MAISAADTLTLNQAMDVMATASSGNIKDSMSVTVSKCMEGASQAPLMLHCPLRGGLTRRRFRVFGKPRSLDRIDEVEKDCHWLLYAKTDFLA